MIWGLFCFGSTSLFIYFLSKLYDFCLDCCRILAKKKKKSFRFKGKLLLLKKSDVIRGILIFLISYTVSLCRPLRPWMFLHPARCPHFVCFCSPRIRRRMYDRRRSVEKKISPSFVCEILLRPSSVYVLPAEDLVHILWQWGKTKYGGSFCLYEMNFSIKKFISQHMCISKPLFLEV